MNYTKYYVEQGILETDLHWFKDNLLLETIAGSQMYGTNNEDSDIDFIAIVMPKPEHIYPQKFGYIPGFDQCPKWERSERKGEDKKIIINEKETEGEWISLIEFFANAALNGSPGMVEVLFARRNLVTFGSEIGWMLRDNRKLFLSMRHFHAFKGYAFSQLQRVKRGYVSQKTDNSKRQILMDKFGYDVKQANHPLRLLDQIEQMLTDGDIDLMRNREECKAMRRGEWGDFEKFEKYVLAKIERLEEISLKTSLPNRPAVEPLHELLMKCIESYYGSEEKFKHTVEVISAKDVYNRMTMIDDKLTLILKNQVV